MGALGSGTSTSYPVTLDTLLYVSGGGRSNYVNGPNPITDSQSRVDAEFMNDIIDAIIAVQTELGTSPSGSFDTVSERLTSLGGAGGGFPGSSTDNAIVRWDGTFGTTLQNSGVIVNDINNVTGILDISVSRNILLGEGAVAGTSLDNGIAMVVGVGPSTSPANIIQLWSADRNGVAGKGSFHVRTEDGTSHVLGDRVGLGTVAPVEMLDVAGAIKLGTTALTNNGTIRYTGSDIEARINDDWVSLTSGSGGGTTGFWNWSTTTSGAPPAQGIGLDNIDYSLATVIRIAEVSSGATDASSMFDSLREGDSVYIQDRLDATRNIRYNISAIPTDNGTWRSIPVSFVSSSGLDIANAQECAVQFTLGGISGSGATNKVTFWSGETTLNASPSFHFDSTTINLGLNVSVFGNDASKVFAIGNGTAPTTSPANAVQLWSADRGATAGKAGLHIRTEDGTSHVFSDFVGLNNLTPLETLDIKGTQRITRIATTSSNIWTTLALRVKGSSDTLNPNFGSYLRFENENLTGTTFELARISGTRGPADNSGILSFTVANAGAFTRTISIDKDANFVINVASVGTNLVQGIVLGSGVAATTSPADAIQMWSADRAAVAGKGSLHLRTEDGTSHVFGDLVGIGTVTPTVALDVVGAIKASDTSGTRTNLGLGTASDVQFNSMGLGIAPSASAPLVFAASIAQKILLYSGGVATRYGIGVGSATLQIFSPATANVHIGGMNTTDGTTFTSSLSVANASGNIGIGTSTFGTSATKTLALFNGVAPTTSPADVIQLWSADRNAVAGKGSLHLRTEDGTSHVFGDMVGIGTVNPTAALDVVGAIKVSDIATTQTNLGIGTAASMQFDRIGLGTPISASARLNFLAEVGQKILLYGDGLTFRNGLGIASGVFQIFSQTSGTIDLGSMATDGTTFTNRVSIHGTSGNVGLGTKTYGTSAVRNFALFAGTAPTTSPVDTVQLWAADRNAIAGTSGLHIRTETGASHVFADFVGIGTVTPSSGLHYAGNTFIFEKNVDSINGGTYFSNRRTRGTLAAPTSLLLEDSIFYFAADGYVRNAADTALDWITLARIDADVDIVDVQGRAGGRISFLTSSGVSAGATEKMRINSSGNIGIGIATFGTGAVRVLALGSGTAPTTSVADAIQMWVADHIGVAGNAALHIMPEMSTLYTFGNSLSIGPPTVIPTTLSAGVHIYGTGGAILTVERNDSAITFPQIQLKKSRGTSAVPAVVIEGDRTAAFYGFAYTRNAANTADAYTSGSLMMYRASNFDAQGRAGGDISWWTSTGVSAGVTEKMYMNTAGQLGIGVIYPTVLPAGSLLTVGNLDVTTGGLVLASSRAAIVNTNVLSGIEFWSNDTTLTAPGALTGYIRSIATETHTATALGSELSFAITKNATATPTIVMRLNNLSNVILFGAQAGTTLEKGIVIGSGIAPTTSPTDAVQLWSADREAVAGTASLHIRTETSTEHIIGDQVGFGLINPIADFHTVGSTMYHERVGDSAPGMTLLLRKSRGTHDAPTRLLAGDYVSYIGAQAWARNAGNTADAWTYITRIDSHIQSADVEGRVGGQMIFYTAPPVSSGIIERMRIDENGYVGLATFAPASRLHVTNNDVTTGGVILGSSRAVIVLDNVLNGIDFWSNDTSYTQPGFIAAYIRAIADEAHASAAIGTRMTFATSAVGASGPTLRMTLRSDGSLSMVSGNSVYLNESGNNRYGVVFGGGNALRLFASDSASTTGVAIGGMSSTDGITFTQVVRVTALSKSMILGNTTAVGTSGIFVFGIINGTAPTTMPVDMVQMWAEDHDGAAGVSSLHIMNEAGWLTKIGNGIIARAPYLSLTTYTVAAPFTAVGADDNGRTFVATNTTVMTQINLPPVGIAYTMKFVVNNATGLRIRAAAGDTIRLGATAGAAAGYIQSTTLGDYIELFGVSSAIWQVRSPAQGWTLGT